MKPQTKRKKDFYKFFENNKLLIGIIITGVMFIVTLLIMDNAEQRKEDESIRYYLANSPTYEIQHYTANKILYETGNIYPFVVFVLSIGLAFGLGQGVALVRVKK